MKMFYGGVPVNSMKVHHFEMDTNDATIVPSDLQSGVTAYARGQKITGTGKSFEFANYGGLLTNSKRYVPDIINVIEISSLVYPIKQNIELNNQREIDFSTSQHIADAIIDGVSYPITVVISSNFLTISCDQTFTMQVFYGKDNYV